LRIFLKNKTYPKNHSSRKSEINSSQIALTSKRRDDKPTVFTTDVADHIDDYEHAPRIPDMNSERRNNNKRKTKRNILF